MSVRVSIDMSNAFKKFSPTRMMKAKVFIASEIVRLTDPFVPFDEGWLKNSVTISPGGSFISYNMPYARRLYFNPQYNFKGAPQRGGLWVERSLAINRKDIIAAVKKYMEGL